MKTVNKGRLKAKMLAYFRELETHGGELIVTDHGRPTLKITPLEPDHAGVDAVFGLHRGRVRYLADILEPTAEEWPDY